MGVKHCDRWPEHSFGCWARRANVPCPWATMSVTNKVVKCLLLAGTELVGSGCSGFCALSCTSLSQRLTTPRWGHFAGPVPPPPFAFRKFPSGALLSTPCATVGDTEPCSPVCLAFQEIVQRLSVRPRERAVRSLQARLQSCTWRLPCAWRCTKVLHVLCLYCSVAVYQYRTVLRTGRCMSTLIMARGTLCVFPIALHLTSSERCLRTCTLPLCVCGCVFVRVRARPCVGI